MIEQDFLSEGIYRNLDNRIEISPFNLISRLVLKFTRRCR